MMHFIFDTLWGWWGVAGVVVIVCIIVGYFIPSLRLTMLAIAGVFLSAASLVTKGNRDRAALERRRRDEAVAKNRAAYDKIDKRPDNAKTVEDRFRKGDF